MNQDEDVEVEVKTVREYLTPDPEDENEIRRLFPGKSADALLRRNREIRELEGSFLAKLGLELDEVTTICWTDGVPPKGWKPPVEGWALAINADDFLELVYKDRVLKGAFYVSCRGRAYAADAYIVETGLELVANDENHGVWRDDAYRIVGNIAKLTCEGG